uniref:Engulfment and cell motility 1 n=2 Tax=Canis lupus familiaris TaxID=9615 RepID=A0A8P0P576_CANLF
MQVVKEQVMRALTTKPSSLDQFKCKLQNLSYTEILKIRQSERMNQEDFQSRPILELKEKIQPEILELIKQQRLNRLVEGTCFRKLNSRRRQVLVLSTFTQPQGPALWRLGRKSSGRSAPRFLAGQTAGGRYQSCGDGEGLPSYERERCP